MPDVTVVFNESITHYIPDPHTDAETPVKRIVSSVDAPSAG